MSGQQLINATKKRNLILVKKLLGQNAPVDYQDNSGVTALMEATSYNKLKIVRELIKAGANLNLQDREGRTALMFSITSKLEIVRELIKSGASLDLQDRDGWTALMKAIYCGQLEIFRDLIKAGAALNIQDNFGRTISSLFESDEIKNLIDKYQNIRENLKRLQDLQSSRLTYFSIIPRDLIGLIKTELEDESLYSI